MPRYEFVVHVTVEADNGTEAGAWLDQELADKLQPDLGTGWHNQGQATPRYQVASVRQVADEVGPNRPKAWGEG